MGEGPAGRARWQAPVRRLLTVMAVAALTVGLFFGYLLQSRSYGANSDAAAPVLQGWEMMHGNVLLPGWVMADVSFYTFEVPLDGLISLVSGVRADVVHVAAATEYALLVLFAALLAAGAARDRRRGAGEAWVRALVAAAIMVAPATVPGGHVLLLAPDHTGIGVPVLAALLVVDRVRPSRRLYAIAAVLAVCLLLTWAQLDDPVAEFGCALPLALACATPIAATGVRRLVGRLRRRGGGDETAPLSWRAEMALHSHDLALFVAAVASYVLTELLIHAINRAGGFYLRPIRGGAQISSWGPVAHQVRALGENLLFLFGANFWGQPQPLTGFAYLHLVSIAVALLGLLVAVWSWPRADRVTRTLVLAIFIMLAAGAVSPLMVPISGAHEIAIVLPLSAALAGRCLGPWLAGRRQASAGEPAEPDRRRFATAESAARVAAACVLVAVGVGSLANLGYNASRPSHPATNQALADWLVAHRLTSGIGGYWDANVTSLDSGGEVRVAAMAIGASYPLLWDAEPAWYDPKVSSANFIIAHTQRLGAGYLYIKTAVKWYGTPAKVYHLGTTVVLVYRSNLLRNVIQPVISDLNAPAAEPPA
jgi:hypothetical protein